MPSPTSSAGFRWEHPLKTSSHRRPVGIQASKSKVQYERKGLSKGPISIYFRGRDGKPRCVQNKVYMYVNVCEYGYRYGEKPPLVGRPGFALGKFLDFGAEPNDKSYHIIPNLIIKKILTSESGFIEYYVYHNLRGTMDIPWHGCEMQSAQREAILI